MWILAVLAFLPLAAVSVAGLAMVIAIFPEALWELRPRTMLLYGGGVIGVGVALLLGLLIVRRVAAARDRSLQDC